MAPVTKQELIDAQTDVAALARFVNNNEAGIPLRLGGTVDSIQYVIDNLVQTTAQYQEPVAYTSGLSITDTNQTVEEAGVIYAPKPASLPIDPTPVTFDANDWYVVQLADAADVVKTTEALIFNRTQKTGFVPASSSASDHMTALTTAMTAAVDGDVLDITGIVAESSSGSFTINKAVKIKATRSKITRKADTAILVTVSATGEVEIDGLEIDCGRGESGADSWNSNDNIGLSINSTVTKFVGTNLYIHSGPRFAGNSQYGIASDAVECHLNNCRIENHKYNLRHRGKNLRVNGHKSLLDDENEATITGATQADPCVITATGHGIPDGTSITIDEVTGMTDLNGNQYVTANSTANTFELAGVNSTAYGAYVSGGKVATRRSHISSGNPTAYTEQTHEYDNCHFVTDCGSGQARLGVIDNDANPAPSLFSVTNCLLDWRSTSFSSENSDQAIIKLEAAGAKVVFDNITHYGDSMQDYAVFINCSGSNCTLLVNACHSCGAFNFPATMGDVIITNSKFGLKSTGSVSTTAVLKGFASDTNSDNCRNIFLENVEFHGLSSTSNIRFFDSGTPVNPDQHIRWKNLSIFGDTAVDIYLSQGVQNTHHMCGTGLHMTNAGAGGVFLSNNNAKRLELSHFNGDPKNLCYGIRTLTSQPQNATSTGYGTSTASHQMPVPDAGTNKFPGVTGFLGDIIWNHDKPANGYATAWIYDSSGNWVEYIA